MSTAADQISGESKTPRFLPPPPADPKRRKVVIGTILLVAIPLLYSAARREIARWYHASALESIYNEDSARALEMVERGLSWNPNDMQLIFRQGEVHLNMGNATRATEAGERALRLARDQFDTLPTDGRRIMLAQALNFNAYAHALDESELEQSLEQVEEAITLVGGLPDGMIDTRGYLHYLLGNDEAAVSDTELAVSLFAKGVEIMKGKLRLAARPFVDRRPFDRMIRQQDENLAVLLQHRGLAYERVGRDEEAEKDFERAAQLGYGPEKGVW